MVKCILFDIDNTLYDADKLIEKARKNAVDAMISAGLPARSVSSTYEKLEKIVDEYGSNYPKQFDRLLEEFEIEEEKTKIIAAGVVAYHNTKISNLKPSKEVKKALKDLKEEYKIGVISNGKSVKQWEKLIRLELDDLFDVVIISEKFKFEKPSEQIFRKALQKVNCEAEEAVMVGDKESDMAAEKVGMNTINIKELDNFKEVKSEVDKFE